MKKLLILLFSILISFNSYGESYCYWKLIEQVNCSYSGGDCFPPPSSEAIVEPLSITEKAQKLTDLLLDDQIKKFDPTLDNVEPIQSPEYIPLFTRKNDTKPFTGEYICKYDSEWENSQVKVNYKDGKLDGLLWWWWGNVLDEINFKDGKKDGKQTNRDESGRRVVELNWKDGKLDGKQSFWNEFIEEEEQAIFKDNECINGCTGFFEDW